MILPKYTYFSHKIPIFDKMSDFAPLVKTITNSKQEQRIHMP